MTEIFKNAPLVQAIFEVRFSGEPAIESRRHEFYDLVRSEFPKVYVPTVQAGEAPSLKPYTYKNEKESDELNVGLNRFSFITLDYPGYQSFRGRFLKYFVPFRQIYGLSKLNRTGLRYVNHIPVLREKGMIPLSNFLNFGYKLPPSIPEEIESLGTFLTVTIGDGHLRIVISHEELQDPTRSEVIALDFDYFLDQDLVADRVEQYLDKSHEHTKKIFVDLVSEKYLQVMRGEVG
jgi:uncharacterized protein (TIGR04255 family)